MSIVPYIQDDGDTPHYLEGPFTIEAIAQNLGRDVDSVVKIARDLWMIKQIEINKFTGQEAALITRKVYNLA